MLAESPGNSYAVARAAHAGDRGLREDTVPPERWMQQIWRHQRIHRDRLRTLDGPPVRVLHPGYWNREPGPDFRDAVIQVGDAPAVRGDVEVDRDVSGWRTHQHAGNPAYGRVVLHVVWSAPRRTVLSPVLALLPHLDAPLAELAEWLETRAPALVPENLPGLCAGPLRDLDPADVRVLIHEAARVRLRDRAGGFRIRARHAGWDQALWEGLLVALGYKHNGWPMRRLAELVPVGPHSDPHPGDPRELWEARLLGLSGLLPAELPRGAGRVEVRRLWDLWWRERDAWEGRIVPRFAWRLGGVRPANHPLRRMIVAARWRAGDLLGPALEQWLERPASPRGFPRELRRLLTPPPVPGDFWSRHLTLGSGRISGSAPLLGASRISELALNVVLPWLYARTQDRNRDDLAREAVRRFFLWPGAGDNAGLRLARERLFGGARRRGLESGAAQQGLHQILQDFCQRAGPLCGACRFPGWVRQRNPAPPPPGAPTSMKSLD